MITSYKMSSAKSVRKNFTMSEETTRELDFLATKLNKKQSQIIQELIHKESEVLRQAARLSKLQQLKGVFTGHIGEKSIQDLKAE